ncbi:hypothetical protein SAMN04489740_0834 [Arthrobacter alpinus]|uniref:Helix-turn-helix domain-containing protein n=1 Tax=Arthrobacter alpinus TaxID=656366 RepID=A0A1H5GSH3_9MICC|nr:hypothetical protein [Arthrobacter alpinus]SEE18454.1 hypothetical protein SAMN04489740_0834 [Arthrobacter alpinus]
MKPSPQTYATAQEMAAKYRISTHTVRSRAAGGQWPCDRIGRLYRFSPEQQEEIAQIVKEGRRPAYDGNRIAAALRQLSEQGARRNL